MAVIGFDRDYLIEYVPTWGGNRESARPLIVRLKYVSFSRIREYSRMLAQEVDKTMPGSISEAQAAIQRRQFIDSVASVENAEVMGSSGARSVTSVAEFYDMADNALITEIIRAMESAHTLTEGQIKNSAPASDGSTSSARPEAPSAASPAHPVIAGPATAPTALDLETRRGR